MFMPVLDIPQRLRDEPTSVAAVGPVLAQIFSDVTDRPPPHEMQELLRRMRGQIDPQPDLLPRCSSRKIAAP
jgi:hypothetical protein